MIESRTACQASGGQPCIIMMLAADDILRGLQFFWPGCRTTRSGTSWHNLLMCNTGTHILAHMAVQQN
jgi:hypothetical protein